MLYGRDEGAMGFSRPVVLTFAAKNSRVSQLFAGRAKSARGTAPNSASRMKPVCGLFAAIFSHIRYPAGRAALWGDKYLMGDERLQLIGC